MPLLILTCPFDHSLNCIFLFISSYFAFFTLDHGLSFECTKWVIMIMSDYDQKSVACWNADFYHKWFLSVFFMSGVRVVHVDVGRSWNWMCHFFPFHFWGSQTYNKYYFMWLVFTQMWNMIHFRKACEEFSRLLHTYIKCRKKKRKILLPCYLSVLWYMLVSQLSTMHIFLVPARSLS